MYTADALTADSVPTDNVTLRVNPSRFRNIGPRHIDVSKCAVVEQKDMGNQGAVKFKPHHDVTSRANPPRQSSAGPRCNDRHVCAVAEEKATTSGAEPHNVSLRANASGYSKNASRCVNGRKFAIAQ